LFIFNLVSKRPIVERCQPLARTETNNNMKNDKPKNRFWIIAVLVLIVLTITTTIGDVFGSALFIFPSIPGFIVYVLVTADIHGWQPGPIGQAGRIIVTTLGSWIFWTPLIYWIYKRRLKKKNVG
jgi:hypothetical protein